MNGLTRGGLRN